MKHAKVWNIFYVLLWVLQLAVEGLTVFSVWRLNMLPNQYLMLLVALFLLLWSLTGALLLIPSKKKNGGGVRKGIAAVLVLAIVAVCAVAVTVTTDVYETLHKVIDQPGEEDEDTAKRSIYVLVSDPSQSLTDVRGYSVGIVKDYDKANVEQVLQYMEQEIGAQVPTVTLDSMLDQVDALYSGNVKLIIVNEANLGVLEEQEGYTDFHEKARLLCEVKITEQEKLPTDPTEPSGTDSAEPTEDTEPSTEPPLTAPSIEEPEDITTHSFLVYIAGSDTRSNKLGNGRNDVNILAVVNPVNKQILLINTPRDYYIANPAGNGQKDKLTHCGNSGVSNSVKALEELYGDRIDYYAQINFKGFETFIDAIDGVTVYSDVSFRSSDGNFRFKKGENVLDGEKALAFARERYNLAGGDVARAQNQMKVIKAVVQKLTSGTTIISRYADILDSLSGMFRTNMAMEEMSLLVKMQLSDMASWEIFSYATIGKQASRVTYSIPGEPLSVQLPVEESVEHARQLIDRVISGEILTEADVNP